MPKIYTGVGDTDTPLWALELIERLAYHLATNGRILRSGGAAGADSAFERGCDRGGGDKTIFLPWEGHRGSASPFFEICDEAVEVARRFHWNYDGQSKESKAFLARDTYQVLGLKPVSAPVPSDYLVCWTADGADGTTKATTRATGGTGQAIRIAAHHKIPVYNLQRPEYRRLIERLLRST